MCYPSCLSSAGGFSVTLCPPLDPRTFSFCFDLLWPVRGGWQDPWGVADPRIFRAPLSCSSYSPWALWPLAAAPPWPPLSVADSTTQWLPLLKQSCFLPLASIHIHFFHLLGLPVHCPPHKDKGHLNCSPDCSARFLPRGSAVLGSLPEVPALFPASVPCPGTHPVPPHGAACVSHHSSPAQECLARCGTLKPTKECQF